jgi:signal transduction histidine kinase
VGRIGRLGLRARATVAWAAIALCLAAGLAVLAYELTRSELIEDRQDRATAQTYVNARLLRSGLRGADPDINRLLSSLEGNVGSRAIARLDGQWFTGSVNASPDQLPASLTDLVESGDAGRQLVAVDGVPHVAVGVPIAEPGAQYFELVSLEDIDGSLGDLGTGLALGAVAATGLAALAGWYASGRVLRPLRRMATASAEIADGSLDTRLDASSDRDLAPMQRAFNRMADAVEQRIEREHRFTSDVSHELRSPLAAMLSSIEVARRRSRDPDAVDDALDHLRERTQGFQRLASDLLEISRVDAGQTELQLEPVRPRALIDAVLAMTGADGVEVDVAADTPDVVQADKRRLGQMIVNLLENADRYARGPTRIELSRVDGMLRIAVEDDGPGVPDHERTHVFGRFARGAHARSSSTPGTGLGLALVDEHAHLHGGRVSVESADGGGARFVIDIPAGGPPP